MSPESNVAVLVDCENVQSAIIDEVMRAASKLGRVTLRRGYGNQDSLANKWQEALVRHGFSPCLQFQCVTRKNTSDIALALDALELLLDRRADCFVIVSSDSDFVGLCRKLRERGAEVHVFGEAKAPAALRHACDRFHESSPQALHAVEPAPAAPAAVIKRRPKFVVEAVRELSSSGGDVDLGALGNHLRDIHPGFSHKAHGYPTLRTMLAAYDLLCLRKNAQGHERVGLAQPPVLRAV